jgi:nucleoid DNA-binding protein
MADGKNTQIPVACSACGGEWFRQASYYSFVPEESNPYSRNWPDLTGQASTTPMTVGVCLCSWPLAPVIGAERGGQGARELTQFLESLERGWKWIRENQEGNEVVAAAKQQLVTIEELKLLEKRLNILQREVGRRKRSEPGPGRYSQLPTRQADSGVRGTLTRDRLALILQQEQNMKFRDAQKVVRIILNFMIQRLRRGEKITVEKLGTFWIKDQPEQYSRRRFGRDQILFRQRTKVVFKPARALSMLLKHKREPAPTPAERKDTRHHCEKCGSTMFVEGEFQQYTQWPSSLPGDDLHAFTEGLPPIRAAICICGHPACQERMRPPLRGHLASFDKSLQMAVRHRELADPQRITDGLSDVLAEKAQQTDLDKRISSIQKIVKELSKTGH